MIEVGVMIIRRMKADFFSLSALFIFTKPLELKLPKNKEPLMLSHSEMGDLTSQGWKKLKPPLARGRCCHLDNSDPVWDPLATWRDPLDIMRGWWWRKRAAAPSPLVSSARRLRSAYLHRRPG